ncbi:ATPase [Roseivivax halodurans JCM 10272]|uniref:ATPase n=1 Tax=Roseivivax halodurans JCM 10272 TaxID=1449350 RepID=X7EFY1_9RHOB|nr:BadF/BadG/BcrA/BcrD ATPase family protein [Roseivivax halodurans]ETX14785.1 ATPase [Roseivivax halodurans JCM 10272]
MGSGSHVIAVDGGGSRCRFLLSGPGGERRIERGPANVFSDFDGAIAVLRDGLAALESETGVDASECPCCLALAGVIDLDVAAQVSRALSLPQARIEEDWRAALEGALGGADGAVVGLGTGSFAARLEGKTAQAIGGHGLALGDEASGAWLGREALRRTLHAAEGLTEASPLTDELLGELGGVAGIVRFGASAAPSDYARLAPRVAAAGQGDPHAAAILSQGADYIAGALHAIGWQSSEPLCLIGGLAETYAAWLSAPLASALIAPRGTALDGALALARVYASEGA